MPALVVLVNADMPLLRRTEAALTKAGYLVAAATSYGEANELLQSVSPDLLITDVRLDEFNGLQLAIRSRLERPNIPVVVTHVERDPILEAEAKRHGVEFVSAPPEESEFLSRVESALYRTPQQRVRRWGRKQVGGTLQVHVADSQARIIDMSYGGVRLAFHEEASIPARFEINLPSSKTPVLAHRVWTSHGSGDEFWCGAELDESAAQWREFVNSVESGTSL